MKPEMAITGGNANESARCGDRAWVCCGRTEQVQYASVKPGEMWDGKIINKS